MHYTRDETSMVLTRPTVAAGVNAAAEEARHMKEVIAVVNFILFPCYRADYILAQTLFTCNKKGRDCYCCLSNVVVYVGQYI
jgi:hypothetical protein